MSLSVASDPLSLRQLPHPAGVKKARIRWNYAATIVFYHIAAALAIFPYFFSWTGVIFAVLGLYIFGALGINVCYHRLLAHRSFTCPQWLERCFAVLGVCSVQDSPIRWVAVHRRHHQHTDERTDPHTPFVNFFWAHVGWLLWENDELDRLGLYSRYARNIARDRFYLRFERRGWYVGVILLSWLVFFLVGFIPAWLSGGGRAAIQFGASLLIWGVFVRTVVAWHITWSVNSITHIWGYQRYATGDGSRNNILIALITSGEGWHNNHHADPRCAMTGRQWWELDTIYLIIRGLAAIGLATNIVQPNPRISAMIPEAVVGAADANQI